MRLTAPPRHPQTNLPILSAIFRIAILGGVLVVGGLGGVHCGLLLGGRPGIVSRLHTSWRFIEVVLDGALRPLEVPRVPLVPVAHVQDDHLIPPGGLC